MLRRLRSCEGGQAVPALRVDIQQDEAGFTIVEEVRVGADVRADYDSAMRFFEQKQYEQGIASLREGDAGCAERHRRAHRPRHRLRALG